MFIILFDAFRMSWPKSSSMMVDLLIWKVRRSKIEVALCVQIVPVVTCFQYYELTIMHLDFILANIYYELDFFPQIMVNDLVFVT